MVESARDFSKNWKPFLSNLNSTLHSASLMCNIQVKASILVIWKIGVFRRKHFLQKQNIFIANNISVVVKDEEMAELLIRSHKKSLIFKAQQITR